MLSIALLVIVAAAVVAAVLLLLLPPLLSPPPEPGPIYDLFEFGEISAPLDPGVDRLLETDDGQVSLYVPVGAYGGSGTMVLQPRGVEFVPLSVEEQVERIMAVDLMIVDNQGVLVESPTFDVELLLCFRLSEQLQARRQDDLESVGIQRFDEDSLAWLDLHTGPGWDPDQICGTIDHLSIFALTIRHPEPTQTPTPQVKEGPTGTPPPLEIYSFPEEGP